MIFRENANRLCVFTFTFGFDLEGQWYQSLCRNCRIPRRDAGTNTAFGGNGNINGKLIWIVQEQSSANDDVARHSA